MNAGPNLNNLRVDDEDLFFMRDLLMGRRVDAARPLNEATALFVRQSFLTPSRVQDQFKESLLVPCFTHHIARLTLEGCVAFRASIHEYAITLDHQPLLDTFLITDAERETFTETCCERYGNRYLEPTVVRWGGESYDSYPEFVEALSRSPWDYSESLLLILNGRIQRLRAGLEQGPLFSSYSINGKEELELDGPLTRRGTYPK